MKNVIKEKIDNCLDCNAHVVLPDPDPNDWFCDDDIKVKIKVTCTLNDKNITVACRPYNRSKECDIPDWCPKLLAMDCPHCLSTNANCTCGQIPKD